MGVLEIIFAFILIVFAIVLTAIVLLQEGSQKNLGTISGAADTFMTKNKARTVDAMLARGTKFFAFGFFIAVCLVNIIMLFFVQK